jgi:hypothetical protein
MSKLERSARPARESHNLRHDVSAEALRYARRFGLSPDEAEQMLAETRKVAPGEGATDRGAALRFRRARSRP